MARKTKKTVKKRTRQIEESALTKGQLRKLNALRKSVGPEIGERAFVQWLARQSKKRPQGNDKIAGLIAGVLWDLIKKKKFNIPRGGYLVTRGRGRVLVTPAKSERGRGARRRGVPKAGLAR